MSSYDKELSRNTACLIEHSIDTNSTYSHIYITSVVHQDLIELRNRLRNQYAAINCTGKFPLHEYKKREAIDNFNRDIRHINLESKRDIELSIELSEIKPAIEPKEEPDEKIEKSGGFILSIIKRQKTLFTLNRKLFLYCLCIAFLAICLQFSFIGVLVREYFMLEVVLTDMILRKYQLDLLHYLLFH